MDINRLWKEISIYLAAVISVVVEIVASSFKVIPLLISCLKQAQHTK